MNYVRIELTVDEAQAESLRNATFNLTIEDIVVRECFQGSKEAKVQLCDAAICVHRTAKLTSGMLIDIIAPRDSMTIGGPIDLRLALGRVKKSLLELREVREICPDERHLRIGYTELRGAV